MFVWKGLRINEKEAGNGPFIKKLSASKIVLYRTIMKDCNCLPYYYPDFSQMWNKSTDCGFEGLKCIAENFGNNCRHGSDYIISVQSLLKYGPIPSSFWFIPLLFTSQFNLKLKNRRCCVWNLNPRPQVDRRRRIHCAMAPAQLWSIL